MKNVDVLARCATVINVQKIAELYTRKSFLLIVCFSLFLQQKTELKERTFVINLSEKEPV